MVVLLAAAPELRGAGLSSDDRVLEPRLRGGAAVGIDDLPHSLADLLDLLGGEAALLGDVCLNLDRILLENAPVLGDDLVDEARLVDGAAVGDGHRDHGHLERRGEDVSLADGNVGGVAGAPALAWIILSQPSGTGKDAGGNVVERKFRFLAEAEHPAHRVDLVDACGIAELEEVGVAGVLDRLTEILMTVRRLLRLGGEDPALHVLVAVLDSARTVELLATDPRADARKRGAELEGGAGRVGVDGPVHERIGGVLGELLPVGLGNGGDELVGIERGNRGHGEDFAVVGIKDHRGPAADDTQRLLDDLLDAGIDGQADLGSLLWLDARGLPVDHPVRVALEETRAGGAPQHVVVGRLDLCLPLDVGLVKVELRRLFLVDFLGDADVAEKMRRERSVDIVTHRLERHGDAGKVEVVLAEAGHGLEVEILPVDEGHLRVVAVVDLQLARVVVAGEPEFLETRDDRLVDDLDDVGLLLEGSHAVIKAPVFALGHRAMLLLPGTDDVGKVKLHLHAGAVFDKRHAVAVADFATHRGKSHRELGMALDSRLVGIPLDDLHVPHAHDEQEEGCGEDAAQDQDLAKGFFLFHLGWRAVSDRSRVAWGTRRNLAWRPGARATSTEGRAAGLAGWRPRRGPRSSAMPRHQAGILHA